MVLQAPLARRQDGRARAPHRPGAVAIGELDADMRRADLLDLQEGGPVGSQIAGSAQVPGARVPHEVPGLGDDTTPAFLDKDDPDLDGPKLTLGATPLIGVPVPGGLRYARQAPGAGLAPEADRHGESLTRHGVGVTHGGAAVHVDADGFKRLAVGAPAPVEGVDEFTDLPSALLGPDHSQRFGNGHEGRQGSVRIEVLAVNRPIAELTDLVKLAPQPRRQWHEVAPVAAARSQDADLSR